MDDYTPDYRTLGVEPGCSLQTLKSARRRLVKFWHPDRYPSGSATRLRAEERIKDINTAFDRLTDYHRTFGVLPGIAEQPSMLSVDSTRSASIHESPAQTSRNDPHPRAPFRWIAVLAAIALAAEGLHVLLRQDADSGAAALSENTPAPAEPSLPAQTPLSHSTSDKYFTVGSSPGEVYAVQGVPTSIENGVWHYGKSKVYFTGGTVTSWEHDSANPLNATILPSDTAKDPLSFTLGSTKSEVRAVQGAPLFETDSLWDYGLSKVYFRDNAVIGWDSSPMRPLKARR
jgi:hypothetical protein